MFRGSRLPWLLQMGRLLRKYHEIIAKKDVVPWGQNEFSGLQSSGNNILIFYFSPIQIDICGVGF
jgi:hypothetical protein